MDSKAKLPAGLSLDLDNAWSYLKTHGSRAWRELPSYLDVLVPCALDLLDELGLRITFFIVGQDAALARHHRVLRLIVERGHEVGNHSFSHEPWLHLYDPARIAEEIDQSARAIEEATGARPRGFRGPGFSVSPAVLEALADRDYLYDASTLPTYLGPLARLYYFRRARLSTEQRAERARLFGTLGDGRRPVRPYLWRLPSGRTLLELPVTTIPGLKTPFHLSYLLYIARYSERLMRAYLELAISLCRLSRTPISFLLHPLDLLGRDQVPGDLSFFPAMDMDGGTKRRLFREVLSRLSQTFDLRRMSEFAETMAATKTMRRAGCYPYSHLHNTTASH